LNEHVRAAADENGADGNALCGLSHQPKPRAKS